MRTLALFFSKAPLYLRLLMGGVAAFGSLLGVLVADPVVLLGDLLEELRVALTSDDLRIGVLGIVVAQHVEAVLVGRVDYLLDTKAGVHVPVDGCVPR